MQILYPWATCEARVHFCTLIKLNSLATCEARVHFCTLIKLNSLRKPVWLRISTSLFLCLPISLSSIFILQTFKMVPLYISPRIVAQVSRWTQYHTFVGSEGQIITLYILLRNLKEIGIYVECKQGSDAIKCVICKRSFWKRDESWVECGHRMMRLRSQGRRTQSKGSRQKERRGPTEEILGSRTERCSKGVRFLTKATEWLMN